MSRIRGIVVLAAAAIALSGCGSDELTRDEVVEAIDDLPGTVKYVDVPYEGDGTLVVGEATHDGITQPFKIQSGEVEVEDVFADYPGFVERSTRGDGGDLVISLTNPPAMKNGRIYKGPGRYDLIIDIDLAVCRIHFDEEDCSAI